MMTLTYSPLRWEAGRNAAKSHHSTSPPYQLGVPTAPAAQNTCLNVTKERMGFSKYGENNTSQIDFFASHLLLCPHLNPMLLIKVTWPQEEAAAVQIHNLREEMPFTKDNHLKTKLLTNTDRKIYVYVIYVIQIHMDTGSPSPFSPYSAWACQMEADCLWWPWRFDLGSSSAAAFQHKPGRQGLKTQRFIFSVSVFHSEM